MMESVGIREFKTNMSRYMKKVKAGGKIIVTDRNKEIAVIMPIENKTADDDKLYHLIAHSLASWSGGIPEGMPERIASNGESVSSAVIEDRR